MGGVVIAENISPKILAEFGEMRSATFNYRRFFVGENQKTIFGEMGSARTPGPQYPTW